MNKKIFSILMLILLASTACQKTEPYQNKALQSDGTSVRPENVTSISSPVETPNNETL